MNLAANGMWTTVKVKGRKVGIREYLIEKYGDPPLNGMQTPMQSLGVLIDTHEYLMDMIEQREIEAVKERLDILEGIHRGHNHNGST